jgi:hypothetical protein
MAATRQTVVQSKQQWIGAVTVILVMANVFHLNSGLPSFSKLTDDGKFWMWNSMILADNKR